MFAPTYSIGIFIMCMSSMFIVYIVIVFISSVFAPTYLLSKWIMFMLSLFFPTYLLHRVIMFMLTYYLWWFMSSMTILVIRRVFNKLCIYVFKRYRNILHFARSWILLQFCFWWDTFCLSF
jgi:hypothetical protein